MSNYNRAYTPKNIVNSTSEADIVELIDSTNCIWYVKTNGHEYLVNSKYLGVSNTGTFGEVDRNGKYPVEVPTNCDYVRFRQRVILAATDNSAETVDFRLESNPIFCKEKIFGCKPMLMNSSGIISYDYPANTQSLIKFNECIDARFPLNQYYDFNLINSNLRNFLKVSTTNTYSWLKPISCNYGNLLAVSKNFSSFNWGLPNSEILIALVKNELFIDYLIKSNPVTFPPSDGSCDLTLGFHTPFFTSESSTTSNTTIQTYKFFLRFIRSQGSYAEDIYKFFNYDRNASVEGSDPNELAITRVNYVSDPSNYGTDEVKGDCWGDDSSKYKVVGWYDKNFSNYNTQSTDDPNIIVSDDKIMYASSGLKYIPMITLPVATLR